MWGIVLCGFLAGVAIVWGIDEGKIVKGQWYVDSMIPCPNVGQYPYQFTAKKTKMNRTHDLFNAKMNLRDEITGQSHSGYIEFCKKMDGGCKLQYTLTPSSICEFAKEFGGENFPGIINNMGIEHDDCPIPKGKMELKDFVVNYKALPEEAMAGEFIATVILIRGFEKVMCFSMEMTFTESDEDDDDE